MANIIINGQSVLQLSHIEDAAFGDSDFDRDKNADAVGDFITPGTSQGDQSTADYVDIVGSLGRKARRVEILLESSGTTRLQLAFNPKRKIWLENGKAHPTYDRAPNRIGERLNEIDYGFARDFHTIDMDEAGTILFTYDKGLIGGFYIDYDAAITGGAGTHNIKRLVITAE